LLLASPDFLWLTRGTGEFVTVDRLPIGLTLIMSRPEAVWAAAASEALQLAAGFAVRRLASADFAVGRLTSAALTAATTLPAVAVDDMRVQVIATDTAKA
jgi:hypothetical protein